MKRQADFYSTAILVGSSLLACGVVFLMWTHVTLKLAPLADHWESFVLHRAYFFGIMICMAPALWAASKKANMISAGIAMLPLILLMVLSIPFGYDQFGGYDLSPMIDAAWRSTCGQVPYVDFAYTLPPSFYAGCVLAHACLGVQWSSFIEIYVLYTVICIILIWMALWRANVRHPAILLLVVAGLMVPQWFTSYWWHSSVTSLACCLFLAWMLAFIEKPASIFNALILAVAMAWLALGKPNGAAPCLILGSGIALLYSRARLRFIAVAALALALFLAALLALKISPYLLFDSYAGIAKNRLDLDFLIPRGLPVWGLELARVHLYLFFSLTILGVVSVIAVWKKAPMRLTPWYLTALVAAGSAYIAMRTNCDCKHNDLPLLIFGAAVALSPWVHLYRHTKGNTITVGVAALVIAALAWTSFAPGASRWRQQLTGYGAFYETAPLVAVDNGYFKGLRAGPRFHAVVREARDVTQKASAQVIFFGPRIEFLYAELQLDSCRKLPLWWHPGSSYPLRQEAAIVNNFKAGHIDLAVFLKDDFTRFPAAIRAYLEQEFVKDNQTYPTLTVFRRKLQG